MSEIKDRVLKRQNTGAGKDFGENIVLLMKYFGWNLTDIERLSVPQYFELSRIINKIEKRNQTENKRKK